MPFKDECNICSRAIPLAYLRRCERCGKLYCRDCMVSDVATGDPTRPLCLHCARRTVSPRRLSKYEWLAHYLRFRGAFTTIVRLSFARIDGIIRDNLPMSAYRNENWWNNSPNSRHAHGWLDAGWEVRDVNLNEGYVFFKKVRGSKTQGFRRRKASHKIKKPFKPVPIRIPKSKTPSKTRVSKLYARIKNLERQKASPRKYQGSFRPRSRYEKKLFKPDEKPH